MTTALHIINAVRLPNAVQATEGDTLEALGIDAVDRAAIALAIEDECGVFVSDRTAAEWLSVADVARTIGEGVCAS